MYLPNITAASAIGTLPSLPPSPCRRACFQRPTCRGGTRSRSLEEGGREGERLGLEKRDYSQGEIRVKERREEEGGRRRTSRLAGPSGGLVFQEVVLHY